MNLKFMPIILIALSIVLASNGAIVKNRRSEGIAGGWPEISNNEGDVDRKVDVKIMMASWGDVVFMYGPQTDAALATPEQIENMIRYWKENGFTDIFWRGEDLRDPNFVWNQSTIYAEASFIRRVTDEVKSSFDTTACVIDTAHKYGMNVYMWQSVFDDGTPPDKLHRKWAQGFPWRNRFFDEHPELDTRDREGNIQWGVRELAYDLARESKVNDYVKAVRKYPGLDGVYVYMHTHSDAPDIGDQYGFNRIIVDEYKRRYGIDILTDPRFDYRSSEFDIHDAAVERWRKLRGEYLTKLLEEIRAALTEIKPDVKVAVNTQGGDYFGPPFGNMHIDWRKWIKDDLIDMLIVRTWMAGGCGAYDFSKEGYLTWGDMSIGATPYTEIREVIENSGNDIKLITRTRAYLEGADGYYDSSNRDEGYPKRQRELQLERNLAEYGKINFIAQNFENCEPLDRKGYLDCTYGGKRYFVGDMRYWADSNTSPGFAGPLTCDKENAPALVKTDDIGTNGSAVFLGAQGLPFSISRRTGRGWPDDPLDKGLVRVSFDIYPVGDKDGELADMAAMLTLNGKAVDLGFGVRIAQGREVMINSGGSWVSSGRRLDTDDWANIEIYVDFNNLKYGLGPDAPKSERSFSFRDNGGQFDGMRFKCYAGSFYVDNIKFEWTYDAQ